MDNCCFAFLCLDATAQRESYGQRLDDGDRRLSISLGEGFMLGTAFIGFFSGISAQCQWHWQCALPQCGGQCGCYCSIGAVYSMTSVQYAAASSSLFRLCTLLCTLSHQLTVQAATTYSCTRTSMIKVRSRK